MRLCVFLLAWAWTLVHTHAQVLGDTTALAARQYASSLRLDGGGVSFSEWVEKMGLSDRAVDLSAVQDLYLPEPRMAYVRVAGTSTIPTNKRTVYKVWIEMYDGEGHYFRKPALLKGQGGYSLRFPKRNFSLQFCNDEWNEDGSSTLTFGEWVEQDGFHVKAFYTDFLRGIGEVGYKLFYRMVADRSPYPQRQGVQADSRARCVPDGFPCMVWLGEDFYGLCSWQLKKSRKNMGMQKTVATHVHLDGNVSDANLFDGKIQWSQFEVRNPKGLYLANGNRYDNNSPGVLMGPDSPYYMLGSDDADTRAAKERSAYVKETVISLSSYKQELQQLEDMDVSEAEFRAAFEERFDVVSLLDYYVFFRLLMNGDGTLKNWQWFTYDGRCWMVTPYDLDQTFGNTLYGFPRPATHTLSRIDTGPFPFINRHYQTDEARRYAMLREQGVFDSELIHDIILDWYGRVGEHAYAMEVDRWPESPCYCPPICNQGWKVCDDWSVYNTTPAFSLSAVYNRGDRCVLHGRIWEATATVTGVQPYIRNSDVDTLQRLLGWVEDRLNVLDDYYGYEGSGMATVPSDTRKPQIEAVYSLSGQRIPMPLPGFNVIRYSDGSSRVVRY